MSNNKQSSVEWLAEQLKEKMQMWNSTKNYQEFHIVLEAGEFAKLIEQAKAMHKEEIDYKIQKAIEKFEEAKNKASTLRDMVYLNGVLSILDTIKNETFGE